VEALCRVDIPGFQVSCFRPQNDIEKNVYNAWRCIMILVVFHGLADSGQSKLPSLELMSRTRQMS